MVDADVLISNILKDLAWQFSKFISLCVYEMTEIASCAYSRSMIVATRHRAVVARFDELIGVRLRVS